MCAPALAVPLLFGSLGVGLYGAQQQASAERAIGKANEQIAQNNARLAKDSARDANIQGARESQQSAWRTRALIATQRAAAASANVDGQLGSAFDIVSDTALLGGIEQETIQLNAARKAWGFEAEATNYLNQGRLARYEGNAKARGTILGGLGNAIGLGAQIAGYKKGG